MTNPYEVRQVDEAPPAIKGQFIERVSERLRQEGYKQREVNTGRDTTLWWKRFSWLPVPMVCYFFVKQIGTQEVSTDELIDWDKRSLDYSNSSELLPAWARWQVPMTVTAVVSETGFSDDVIKLATGRKLASQSGQPHALILVDEANRSVHMLKRPGQSIAFKNAHNTACRAFIWNDQSCTNI